MADDTTDLDGHRGMAALKATVLRRQDLDVERLRENERARQGERENLLVSVPSKDLQEAMEKARYLLERFSHVVAGSDTRMQGMIAIVLADFERLRGDGATP